eukprot:Skav204386  [mRNA]  locus=scaffold2947:24764:26011:+ [translate_table: standard]
MQLAPPGLELVGRSYDLRKAYRQIAIKPEHLDLAWISVFDPTAGKVRLFRMESMPFGATASVSAFLRISQAIKLIGIAGCALVWSSFYDDFVCVCEPTAVQQTERMVEVLFSSLGWELSKDDDKNRCFAKTFCALGVQFDLNNVGCGWFTVDNTEARKEELQQRIDDILAVDMLFPDVATSLRSRLLFAESQIFGRQAQKALHAIGDVGLCTKPMRPLSEEVHHSLTWLRDRVVKSEPRRVEVADRPVFHLFLDGACSEPSSGDEWSGTSVGGVLLDSAGKFISFFGKILDPNLVKTWGREGQKQFVFEAEVLPYSVALETWKDILAGACIFVYIDNEAAKSAWITGFADSKVARRMLHFGTHLEAALDVHPYFCRVPTFSNIADLPSRGKFSFLLDRGAVESLIKDDLVCKIVS